MELIRIHPRAATGGAIFFQRAAKKAIPPLRELKGVRERLQRWRVEAAEALKRPQAGFTITFSFVPSLPVFAPLLARS